MRRGPENLRTSQAFGSATSNLTADLRERAYRFKAKSDAMRGPGAVITELAELTDEERAFVFDLVTEYLKWLARTS